jgi:hypothetical protein
VLAVAELREDYRGMTLRAKDRRAAGREREADSSANRGTAAGRQLAVDRMRWMQGMALAGSGCAG